MVSSDNLLSNNKKKNRDRKQTFSPRHIYLILTQIRCDINAPMQIVIDHSAVVVPKQVQGRLQALQHLANQLQR
jgi:hypothetical protein